MRSTKLEDASDRGSRDRIQVQDVRAPDCEAGSCIEVHDLPTDGDVLTGVMLYSTDTDTKMQATRDEFREFLRDVKYTDKYDHYLPEVAEKLAATEAEVDRQVGIAQDPEFALLNATDALARDVNRFNTLVDDAEHKAR